MNSVRLYTKMTVPFFLAILLLTSCFRETERLPDYPIRPVSFTKVSLTDPFWAPRIRTNHEVTIPLAFQKSEETGRIDNFKVAGGHMSGGFCSLYPFDDSDVFKNIEAASYSMQLYPDPALDAYLDTLISFIADAREADGYLYTNRTIDPLNTHDMAGKERWGNIEGGSHELYNVGHLYEAAVAHYQATGKTTLLDVALKNAGLIDSLFGWGKLEIAPGHQEIEIGLVKLYRITGERKYLDLAKFFLDVRGPGGSEYHQMHRKPVDQDQAVGHAVRAQYMYAAMADIAALTGDQDYLSATGRLWQDVVSSKTYVTGGIGAVRANEGFGEPYDLPNEEAYCETCAAIANALWNYRMFLLKGESKYFDVFEKVLYNGLLSGVSLEGDHFFYPNPLASSGQHQRKPWFGCACCPVNITRFLPSLPGYVYAIKDHDVYVNLFMSNTADLEVNGKKLVIEQLTDYPWNGDIQVKVKVEKPMKFGLKIRLPGWAVNDAFPGDLYEFVDSIPDRPTLSINGTGSDYVVRDGYICIERVWKNLDEVNFDIPMKIRKVAAHHLVRADSGRVALQYGPLMYCAEQADQEPSSVRNLMINAHTRLEFVFAGDLPGRIGSLNGVTESAFLSPDGTLSIIPQSFRVIPYFAWANRGAGEMVVWFPQSVELTVPVR